MSITRHYILNYVDTPLRILIWTMPEFLMLISPILLGLMIEQLTVGVLLSIGYRWVNKKYQRSFGKGQLQAVKYWFLPPDKRFKTLPPSYIREYIG